MRIVISPEAASSAIGREEGERYRRWLQRDNRVIRVHSDAGFLIPCKVLSPPSPRDGIQQVRLLNLSAASMKSYLDWLADLTNGYYSLAEMGVRPHDLGEEGLAWSEGAYTYTPDTFRDLVERGEIALTKLEDWGKRRLADAREIEKL